MDHGFYPTNLNGEGLCIDIVQARFNEPMYETLCEACVAEFEQLGAADEDMLLVTVPDALEIPPALQKMAELDQFDTLIVLSTAIRGKTHHFELVPNESSTGTTRVGLDSNIAIANDILTTDTDVQVYARTHEKDYDCARTAAEMANLTNDLDGLQDRGQDDNGENE